MGSGFSIRGKIESGSVQVSDRINILPASESGACKSELQVVDWLYMSCVPR